MTVSYDAVASLSTEERCGDESLSWTHTPSGTPKAIVVIVTTGATTLVSGDNAVSGVTYGGVSMTKVQEVHKGTGESMNCWYYELLSGIPTGAQTVVVTTDACPPAVNTGNYPWFMAHSVSLASGGGTISRAATSTLTSDSTASPTITLDAGSNTGLAVIGGGSGIGTHTNVTAATGCTKATGYSYSGGGSSSVVAYQTTPATGSFAVGFAQSADDAGMAAASYYEVAATMSDPLGMSGFFGG